MVNPNAVPQKIPLAEMRIELTARGIEFPERATRAMLARLLDLSADRATLTEDQRMVLEALAARDTADIRRSRERQQRWYLDRELGLSWPAGKLAAILDELHAKGLASQIWDAAGTFHAINAGGWQAIAPRVTTADKIRGRAGNYAEEARRFRQALADGRPLVSFNHDGMWAKVWENVGRELNEVADEIDKENDHE